MPAAQDVIVYIVGWGMSDIAQAYHQHKPLAHQTPLAVLQGLGPTVHRHRHQQRPNAHCQYCAAVCCGQGGLSKDQHCTQHTPDDWEAVTSKA